MKSTKNCIGILGVLGVYFVAENSNKLQKLGLEGKFS
jgi:hypothetical protein